MNAARKLASAILDLTLVVKAIEEGTTKGLEKNQENVLLMLLNSEAKVIALHTIVGKLHGRLPLQIVPLSDTSTQTGIAFKESGDKVKFDVPRVWHLRMKALLAEAEAIVEALDDECAKPPRKSRRSKHETFFRLIDNMTARGTTLREATLSIMRGDDKAAKSLERMWHRRNKAIREEDNQRRNRKQSDTNRNQNDTESNKK